MASTTLKPCPNGGTLPPGWFTVNAVYNGGYYTGQKICSCHSANLNCGSTEDSAYCMQGCSTCHTAISAKNKREAEHLANLEAKLRKTEEALNAERARLNSLSGTTHFSQVFQSPIVAVKLNHPSVGPTGASYNLHLNRLATVSTHFRDRSETLAAKPIYKSKDLNPVAFEYFVEYLYSGNYVLPSSHDQIACYIHTLVYFLADTLGAPELKDLAKGKLSASLKHASGIQPGDKVVVKMVDATYAGTSDENSFAAKLSALDTGVMVTPASSTRGDDTDAESDTDTEVPEGGKGASMPSTTVSGDSQLDRTLASLDLDETPELAVDITADPHPMRLLVSRYAASRMEALNKRSDFRALLRRFPEFTVDMMIAKEAMAKEKK
ncbi:hypothetical protein BJ508DRAFT_416548 [Ascobolus immersus RN42]|uniref:BTB domain-containing protein n=1 Tax=Ascobolus immersus RN42 TaxID=1160509 RepID=A0A3N4I2X1_ASCIM|nr:hypothetical protein BJ508DRAFT_416548 [Ascobolus immersus RN42]